MKDPETLLRAFAMLECPRAHLLIAGDGSLRNAMERLVTELDLASRVTMLGALPLHDLAELQRISSVLVLTSAYEGLPLVVLETLACGTPIVTTPSGDTAHVVTSASGIVTEGFEAESIVAALDAVLASPDRFPAAACVEAARPFSADAVVAEVFDEMLHRWRRQQPRFGDEDLRDTAG
jgi:glycosyltransferase involved in cell wall biosynthesis